MLNEKENLKPWLENLEWADQIILVDHGSVDGSLEQARLQPNCHCISATPGEGLIEDIRRLGIAEVSEGWGSDHGSRRKSLWRVEVRD